MNPIGPFLAVASLLALSACGGGGGGGDVSLTRSYATGPIQVACMRSDRRAAGAALCGCVQAVANASLSRSDQVRAVQFFRDPPLAQTVRQSDNGNDEAFWKRYKAFVSTAERSCS